ncbi:MAG: Fic family protein [Deltaproteobacteria bacterium]|nr:Fic family protein [Deltaproteobacteria bacterium]
MLGECHALLQVLRLSPLQPEDRQELLSVSLRKGAQATTAIEGNTLSEEEIERLQEGWSLPPSKEYLEIEVKNILEAFNALLHEIIEEDKVSRITPDLIMHFHKMIGKGLGEHFDAIPGKFREDRRHVGPYLAPDHRHVPGLIKDLCDWLKNEFHYKDEGQGFRNAVIQAIVTHVYIEWIHPFGDGNGRTGRLLEFYILLRSGLPNIVSHILSNFYNLTRPEYYRQLDRARKKRNLTEFIQYTLQGFRDGLKENLHFIQERQFSIFWRHYIYDTFADLKYTKKAAFKRKRALILQIPIGQALSVDELLEVSPDIAKRYAKVGRATALRDLRELQELNLLKKIGRNYETNAEILVAMMPHARNQK